MVYWPWLAVWPLSDQIPSWQILHISGSVVWSLFICCKSWTIQHTCLSSDFCGGSPRLYWMWTAADRVKVILVTYYFCYILCRSFVEPRGYTCLTDLQHHFDDGKDSCMHMHLYVLKLCYMKNTQGVYFHSFIFVMRACLSCPSVQLVGWCTCRKSLVYEGVKGLYMLLVYIHILYLYFQHGDFSPDLPNRASCQSSALLLVQHFSNMLICRVFRLGICVAIMIDIMC